MVPEENLLWPELQQAEKKKKKKKTDTRGNNRSRDDDAPPSSLSVATLQGRMLPVIPGHGPRDECGTATGKLIGRVPCSWMRLTFNGIDGCPWLGYLRLMKTWRKVIVDPGLA